MYKILFFFVCFTVSSFAVKAQQLSIFQWTKEGTGYYNVEKGQILQYELPALSSKVIVSTQLLTPSGKNTPLKVEAYEFSTDKQKVLIYTNSSKVWRYNTRGDYWVADLVNNTLKKVGKDFPESSIMFAKFSNDGRKIAYVHRRNIYVEDIATQTIKQLTSDNGTKKLINGTFDWAYEEEFSLRDGFRWSSDNQSIAYWQIDANAIKDFYMINNTDSVYSRIVPVEYPKAGDTPSSAKIGVVNINTGNTTWMKIPGEANQHYLTRMEWHPQGKQIIVQQLNRKQNESKIFLCNALSGEAQMIFSEKDEAWVSHVNEWKKDVTGWDWLNEGKEFLWTSEQDGWRHVYKISIDGKSVQLLTKGNYDVIETLAINPKTQQMYFYASPDNATQRYLYKTSLTGKGKPERLSPTSQVGTHTYEVSPNGQFARHSFSNYFTPNVSEWIEMANHAPLANSEGIREKIKSTPEKGNNIFYFKITTQENVEMDGWMIRPPNFDENKKYPVVFYVYGEPATATVKDAFGEANSFIYNGDMASDGYIHISLDNRGTPAPKGRAWRKAIYGKIGQVNIRDQAMAAKKILEWKYIDKDRVAVWGWSGGGSSTLNLMFQYPDIYKVGISVAPVTASYLYDNIYTERYMGLPQENMDNYKAGAAITHAKNLKGKLLLVHGTGDDNVHFQNSEMLVNELIKYNKQFSFMAYPNRTHGISEGKGTVLHLLTLCTNFLKENCPGGAR